MRSLLRRAPLVALTALALAAAAASAVARVARRGDVERSEARLARATPAIGRDDYVGSDACAACHPAAHATWAATYHRTMTQRAGPDSVLAPFDGRDLVGPDGEYRVERRGDEYWARLVDPAWKLARAERGEPLAAGPRVWRRVVMTTGSHHMQLYWVESGAADRTLHAFPFAWLRDEARWVPVESTLLRPPEGDAVYTWNRACIPCHAVAGQPRLEGRVDTRVAELGIACEACHGPGAAHVAARRDPLARYAAHLSSAPDPTIVQPARLEPRAAAEACGQCHSVSRFADEAAWLAGGDAVRPGAPLEGPRQLVRHPVRASQPWHDALLDEDPEYLSGRMWSDGHVRVTGREYSALLETPCFTRGGMTCLSCHQMHGAPPDDQLAPGMDGDAACAGCHPREAESGDAHTHHRAGGPGSGCLDCHMPHTTYGLLKAVRSHVVDSPDVEVALATGRPDACSLCHLDRPLAWTAAHLQRWYGRPAPALPDEHRSAAASVLWAIRGDAGQRALAAWHLGWAPAHAAAGADWQAPLLAHLLADPYDAVRHVAARALRRLPGFSDIPVDAVAPADARAAAAAAVLARWRERPRPTPNPAVLIDPRGELDLAALARLAADRDERPIDLKE